MISIKKIQLQWALTHIDALTHARSHTQTHTDTHRHIHSHTQTRIDTFTHTNNVIKMTITLRISHCKLLVILLWFHNAMDRITGSRVYSDRKRFICSTHCTYVILTHQTVLSLTCKPYTVFFHSKLDAILRIGALLCVRIVSNRMYLVKSDFL